ncbi:hypothetical protein BIFGAL_03365 [Bifidobacterium gallicum DSM 20093 = LMG 11596]|uniref:Uncharacterized protein n=1 Tax=Bifidobacterium gallicum DSM 20093 = LMG 11596 TaxID=561180 RepID=D1NU44_9BIFI|nr:hypothetical protein BIFGAL_03365 [Bifidobacterium gallicum DSM 20093 = LMG 11596]
MLVWEFMNSMQNIEYRMQCIEQDSPLPDGFFSITQGIQENNY